MRYVRWTTQQLVSKNSATYLFAARSIATDPFDFLFSDALLFKSRVVLFSFPPFSKSEQLCSESERIFVGSWGANLSTTAARPRSPRRPGPRGGASMLSDSVHSCAAAALESPYTQRSWQGHVITVDPNSARAQHTASLLRASGIDVNFVKALPPASKGLVDKVKVTTSTVPRPSGHPHPRGTPDEALSSVGR